MKKLPKATLSVGDTCFTATKRDMINEIHRLTVHLGIKVRRPPIPFMDRSEAQLADHVSHLREMVATKEGTR